MPLGRKAWLFCGSDRGGQRAAVLYTLIQTARLNHVDPQAWLADRRACTHRRPPRDPAGRTAAVALGASDPGREDRLMAAPSMVFTARYAARHFGVDLDVIEELAEEIAPEDGRLSVIDCLDDDAESTTAFTRHGLDYLDKLLHQRRSDFTQES